MPFDIITIGSAVRDVYIHSDRFVVADSESADDRPRACFMLGGKIEVDAPVYGSGGGATNAAASFAHFGLRTACVAKIGTDRSGQDVTNDLHTHGVHTNLLVKTDREGTGYSILLTTGSGQRTALVYRGAAGSMTATDIPWEKLDTKWLYLTSVKGNLPLIKRLFKHAAANNIAIAWNPGSQELRHGLRTLSPLVSQCDALLLNREEAALLTSSAPSDLSGMLHHLLSEVPRYAAVTDGARGAYAAEGHNVFHALTNDVPTVNVTGAGDAFGAGFITGIIAKESIVAGLQIGMLNAESVIQQVGAKNGLLPRLPGSRALGKIKVEPFVL